MRRIALVLAVVATACGGKDESTRSTADAFTCDPGTEGCACSPTFASGCGDDLVCNDDNICEPIAT